MSKIKLLPPTVIQQIAAGEVAERPAVIIKELLENALDAQATEIEIHLQQAGLEQILVTDNGIGMDEADLALAYQRYTTSKISQPDDLWRIKTLGFRGEALASIAQVSILQLISRPTAQKVGHKIVVHEAEVLESQPVATQSGTTIIVEQLFATQPVRKKFLKHQAAELKAILRVVSAASLSHPRVGFLLKNENATLLDIPQSWDLRQRTAHVLHVPLTSLIPISHTSNNFTLSGFVTTTESSSAQSQQFLNLNQRPILYPAINRAIKNAYGTLLEKTISPGFVLNLELPPDAIDLHIHPRKETVRLAQEKEILSEVTEAIKQLLANTNSVHSFSHLPAIETPQPSSFYPEFKAQMSSPSASTLKNLWQPETQTTEILQIDLTYLAFPTSKGLLLVDQHAAHERILYEEYAAQLAASPLSQTSVELPQSLELSLSTPQRLSIEEHLPLLAKLGFGFSQTGRQFFVLHRVPQLFKAMTDSELSELVMKMLSLCEEQNVSLTTLTHELLARLACRTAIQAGDFLTPAQRLELLKKQPQVPNHTNCPHGRPTTLLIDIPTLEKKFKRRK